MISIIIITVMISIELFYLTQKISFLGCFFEYLPLFIPIVLRYILDKFKELSMFWPCSFIDPSVKGTNNFWKFRGIIDGFSESCRKIVSRVGKTSDESMSDIRFCITPKGYLPHNSYIFRNPEPLRT